MANRKRAGLETYRLTFGYSPGSPSPNLFELNLFVPPRWCVHRTARAVYTIFFFLFFFTILRTDKRDETTETNESKCSLYINLYRVAFGAILARHLRNKPGRRPCPARQTIVVQRFYRYENDKKKNSIYYISLFRSGRTAYTAFYRREKNY